MSTTSQDDETTEAAINFAFRSSMFTAAWLYFAPLLNFFDILVASHQNTVCKCRVEELKALPVLSADASMTVSCWTVKIPYIYS